MGDPLMGYGNYADSAVLSNGSWLSTLPLDNLRNEEYGLTARSGSADPAATVIDADLGAPRLVRIVGLFAHNLSQAATYRVTAAAAADYAEVGYDSGPLKVWPPVYPFGAIPWGASNFWERTSSPEERAGLTPHLIHLLPSARRFRHWRLGISDEGNPDGHIEAGRLFLGDAWQARNGVAFGASVAVEDPSQVQAALSGAEYFDRKSVYRVARFVTHFMPTDDAYSRAFEIQRRSGSTREVVYVHDPDDTVHAIRRRFPGRLRVLSPVENPYPDFHHTAWEIKERTP